MVVVARHRVSPCEPDDKQIDGQGCEIGNIAGPAEWDSEDAIKLINAATQ